MNAFIITLVDRLGDVREVSHFGSDIFDLAKGLEKLRLRVRAIEEVDATSEDLKGLTLLTELKYPEGLTLRYPDIVVGTLSSFGETR